MTTKQKSDHRQEVERSNNTFWDHSNVMKFVKDDEVSGWSFFADNLGQYWVPPVVVSEKEKGAPEVKKVEKVEQMVRGWFDCQGTCFDDTQSIARYVRRTEPHRSNCAKHIRQNASDETEKKHVTMKALRESLAEVVKTETLEFDPDYGWYYDSEKEAGGEEQHDGESCEEERLNEEHDELGCREEMLDEESGEYSCDEESG